MSNKEEPTRVLYCDICCGYFGYENYANHITSESHKERLQLSLDKMTDSENIKKKELIGTINLCKKQIDNLYLIFAQLREELNSFIY